MIAHVAQIVQCTEAEGPGRRFALWFQGCPLRCPGCCNPEMLPFAGGQQRDIEGLIAEIQNARSDSDIDGISLLGGEPLAHAPAAAMLARAAWSLNLSVMIYSGYTLAEARQLEDPAVADVLAHCDVLVDGPYLSDQPETRRRWVGSTNQVVHFFTDRYQPDEPRWTKPNTIELRLRKGELVVNGFPAPAAADVWKRMPLSARRLAGS